MPRQRRGGRDVAGPVRPDAETAPDQGASPPSHSSVAAPALGELAVDDASAVSPTPSLSSASNHKSVAKSMRTSNAKHSVDVSQPSLPQQDDEANDTAAKLRNETIAQALARARARRQKPNQS